MNLTKAARKILAFTNQEFYDIFIKDSYDFLLGFELFYIDLPQDLKDIAQRVASAASREMTKALMESRCVVKATCKLCIA